MAIAAQIYDGLVVHPQLLQAEGGDPVSDVLSREYMPHGTLKEYV